MINKKSIKLKKVTKSDLGFLYKLLKERDSRANISHRKMPSYEEHVKFVLSNPYSKWYIIMFNDEKIGSIYLSKQDEIGIFLEKKLQSKGVGKFALELLIEKNPRERFLANVNPKNLKSAKFFEHNGFKKIQHTYELLHKNNKNTIK